MRKDCQTMYNNYEMAKTDLDALNVKMEQARITLKKVEELDNSKNLYRAYGAWSKQAWCVGSMYMLQDHNTTKQGLEDSMKELSAKIESVTVPCAVRAWPVEASELLREALQRTRSELEGYVVW